MRIENRKRLSIITINYNNRGGLRKTIESVAIQTFRDFEYVIIDGGSTDGSVEVIKEYADKIDYWVSEKDKGIYNAMNKGAFAAHGEYTLFLNSGDVLYSEVVLEKVFEYELGAEIVSCCLISDQGKIMRPPYQVTFEFFIRGTLPHPSTFIKRSLFRECNFDEKLKISADWLFFAEVLIKRDASYKTLPQIVSVFDTKGISSTQGMDEHERKQLVLEIQKIVPRRVWQDYDIFMGRTDFYFELFYILHFTRYKKIVYTLFVMILKLGMMNRGWISRFPVLLRKKWL